MRIHLWMCHLCAGFRDDLQHLHDGVQETSQLVEQDQILSDEHLPNEARQRIREAIEARP